MNLYDFVGSFLFTQKSPLERRNSIDTYHKSIFGFVGRHVNGNLLSQEWIFMLKKQKSLNIRKIRNKEKGFFLVENIFFDRIARHLSPHNSTVYFYLCRRAEIDKQTCFPSRELIAKETNMSVRTVGDSINKLEKLDLIYIWRSKKADGSFQNNLYTLLNTTKWEYQPQANNAVGIKVQAPRALKDSSHRHQLPNKETNSKETNNKEDFIKKSEEKEFHLRNYKPDFLKRI